MPQSVVFIIMLSSWTAAASPPVVDAQAFHRDAVAASRNGDLDEAARLWRLALAHSPDWKYAFNLIAVHTKRGDSRQAFDVCQDSQGLPFPPEDAAEVRTLCQRAESALLSTAGLVAFTSDPPGAQFVSGGSKLVGGRYYVSMSPKYTVEANLSGHAKVTLTVDTPPGDKRSHVVRLERLERRGTLKVSGVPPEAHVSVVGADGKATPLGRLGDARAIPLKTGAYTLRVEREGRPSIERTVVVRDGAETTETVELAAGVDAPTTLPDRTLWYTGIGLLSAGVAVTGAGAGLLGWAGVLAEEGDAINADPGPDGVERFEETERRFEGVKAGGIACAVIGGSAMVAGIVLMALDVDGVTVSAIPTAQGAFVVGTF